MVTINEKPMRKRIGAMICVAFTTLALAACMSSPITPGTWQLRAPGGSTESVDVTQLRKDEYYLRAPGLPFSGVYKLTDHELRISKPDAPRLNGYVWRLNKDRSLVLVEEAPVPLSGQRLVSSTMTRQ